VSQHDEADHLPIEQRAIGAMLAADDAVAMVRDAGARVDYFTDPAHRVIFSAALQVAADDEHHRADSIGIFEFLERTGQSEDCGGLQYLHQLGGCVITARNFGKDIERLRSRWQRRQVMDKLAQAGAELRGGGDPVEAVRAAADLLLELRSEVEAKAGPALFQVVPIDDLASARREPTSYWWDHYLPACVVTLLSAHGGTGKSMIGLMLAVSVALGLPLFGASTRRGKVAFFSGEDPGDLVRYRLHWICEKLAVDPAELDGHLHVLDATAGDPVLFHEVAAGGRRFGATTPAYSALQAYVESHAVDVLIVDNASDAFDASEIDRAKVRGFMRALARLAQVRSGAVLLLAHVDKGTSRGERSGTEGYSGSTAWHNSARSRIYLSRDKDGALLLEHQKSNLGRLRDPVSLEWPHDGLPQLVVPLSPVVQGIADRNDTRAALAVLHEFHGRGEYVATSAQSPSNAARVLGTDPAFPRRKPAEVFNLLRDAERRGLIERQQYRNTDRKERERWALTAAGCNLIGKPAPSAPSAPSDEPSAPSAGGAPSAPTPAWGVRGGGARTEVGAEATP
jgi:putative DNA primase/helicase